jgi:hypothetical protein
MAAFSFKRTGFGSGNRGRKGTINDTAMSAVLAAYKSAYGQIPSGPPDSQTGIVPMRDMTDDEVTDKLFDGLIQGLADQANADVKIKAAKTATDAITPIAPVLAGDNT